MTYTRKNPAHRGRRHCRPKERRSRRYKLTPPCNARQPKSNELPFRALKTHNRDNVPDRRLHTSNCSLTPFPRRLLEKYLGLTTDWL